MPAALLTAVAPTTTNEFAATVAVVVIIVWLLPFIVVALPSIVGVPIVMLLSARCRCYERNGAADCNRIGKNEVQCLARVCFKPAKRIERQYITGIGG